MNKGIITNKPFKTICDKCKSNIVFETGILDYIEEQDKLVVEGYECIHCGAVYVVAVTDNKLRKNIVKAKELNEEYAIQNRLREAKYNLLERQKGYIPQSEIDYYSKLLNNLYKQWKSLKNSNIKRGELLKKRYEESLVNDQVKEE